MRLIVFVVLVLECCGILATQARLYVEIMGLAPALIYKILAQMQVPLLTRHPIQFHQRELDFFMPGVTAFLAWRGAKDCIDVVRIATQRIQQHALASGLEMRHRSFDEVTGTIQLMPVTQIRPALLRLNNGEIGIEIAIGLLGGDNKTDNFVNLCLQRRIWMGGKTVARGFKPLGDIRVPEDVWNWLRSWFPIQPQGVNTSRLLAEPVHMRQGVFSVYANMRRPKRVVDGNRLPGDWRPRCTKLLR